MSIATSLQKVLDSKEAIKTSINNKGGQITSATPFSAYSAAIDNLPSGGNTGTPIVRSVNVEDFVGTTILNGKGYLKEVTIPSGVTSLGANCFNDFLGIEKVNLNDSLSGIGKYCFQSCSSLTSVTIPDSVSFIDAYAFRYCSGLTEVNFGQNPTLLSINEYVFSSCVALPEIYIPEGVGYIQQYAFNYSTALSSITIPSTVISIGSNAFRGTTALADITIKATTPPSITADAFSSSSAGFVIYVPAESVEAYKGATNWSAYSSRIQAIPSA